MRILYVCTDADIGGAERFLLTLAQNKSAHDTVGILVLMGRGALSDAFESSADWTRHLGHSRKSRNLPKMLKTFKDAVREFSPDIISSHLFHADLVVALSRTEVPKTTTIHTQRLGSQDHPLTRIIARAVGLISSRFAAVIPTSGGAHMQEFLRKFRYRHVVDPIPNAAVLPPRSLFDPGSRILISLARNHPVKGHRVLFEAAASFLPEHPEWTLTCYGSDVVSTDSAMVDALTGAGASHLHNSGRIRLEGPVSNPLDVLETAAALVISSGYGESFPIVGVEAASAGVPVITTDVGSCREFADDPRFVVPPADAPALAQSFDRYARLSQKERLSLSQQARARAERRYSPARAVKAYRSVFESVIASRAR